METYPIIIMPYGTLRKLQSLCKRTIPCIKEALKGHVTKIEHLQIRKQAIVLGGVEVPDQPKDKEVRNGDTN